MPIFWRIFFFYHKWVLNFVKSFFCICWDYHLVLCFNLLIWCITLIDLCILKNPCIPVTNMAWSWCVVEFCLLKFCWGFLHLCSSMILTCSFHFLFCLCPDLVSGGWWPHRMSLEVFLPWQFFERVLEG